MQYHDDELRKMIADGTMTTQVWRGIGYGQRERVRDTSNLCPELRGLEGCRIECEHYDERVRFLVGMSTGWKPCHIRLHNCRSMGGDMVSPGTVRNVRVIRRAR